MKRMGLLVLIVLLLSAFPRWESLSGCKDAADTSPSSTLSILLSNTGGRPLATLPSVSPDEPGTGLEQRQRFVAVWQPRERRLRDDPLLVACRHPTGARS